MVVPESNARTRMQAKQRLANACRTLGVLPFLQRARGLLRSDLRILAYHRVLTLPHPDPNAFDFDLELVSASAQQFRDQMLLLRRRYRPITLGAVLATFDAGEQIPPDSVVVTFDDGYDDNYRVAFPILRELGVPATFFVCTGHIASGRPFAYDWLVHMVLCTHTARLRLPELGIDVTVPDGRMARRRLGGHLLDRMKLLPDLDQTRLIARLERDMGMPREAGHPDCRPMNWEQLREMRAAGMEIGSHGVDHRMMSKVEPPVLEDELRLSKATLESELGGDATVLSYPVGGDRAFDNRVIATAMTLGYRAACSYICGTNRIDNRNRYALRRLPVEYDMGDAWFGAVLALPELFTYTTPSRIG